MNQSIYKFNKKVKYLFKVLSNWFLDLVHLCKAKLRLNFSVEIKSEMSWLVSVLVIRYDSRPHRYLRTIYFSLNQKYLLRSLLVFCIFVPMWCNFECNFHFLVLLIPSDNKIKKKHGPEFRQCFQNWAESGDQSFLTRVADIRRRATKQNNIRIKLSYSYSVKRSSP